METKNFCPYIDSLGGTSVWGRVQDLYHRGAGDSVWGIEQLGVGSDLLGWGCDGGYLAIKL